MLTSNKFLIERRKDFRKRDIRISISSGVWCNLTNKLVINTKVYYSNFKLDTFFPDLDINELTYQKRIIFKHHVIYLFF